MDLDVYEHLILRALELGVPHTIVAELFVIPASTAKELQKNVRVTQFGTADRDEFLEHLQFKALERASKMLSDGSPDQAAKIVNAVFGRQLQNAGRRPSGALEEQRAAIMAMFGEIREAPPAEAPAGKFVLGRVDVDRRAHQGEDDED